MKNEKHYTIPVFVPEEACPNRCVYCNQFNISGAKQAPSIDEARFLIEKNLQTIDYNNSEVEIGFFGGSFTGIPIEKQLNYLQLAKSYIDAGKIKSIRLSTRPDYINDEILSVLKDCGVRTIEIGAQSLDEEVLRLAGRGHSTQQVLDAAFAIKMAGFNLGMQMMIGLPGDNLEKAIQTACCFVSLGADDVRIYPTVVIKDTELENLYSTGNYKTLSLEEAVEWTKHLYFLFEENNVKVIRVGLHPSDDLTNNGCYIDGPYHQSFRELVLTEIWYDLLKPFMNRLNSANNIIINVPASELNYAIGYNKRNKLEFLKLYKNAHFKIDNTLKNREFSVDYL